MIVLDVPDDVHLFLRPGERDKRPVQIPPEIRGTRHDKREDDHVILQPLVLVDCAALDVAELVGV